MNDLPSARTPYRAIVLSIASAGRRDGSYTVNRLLESARIAGRTRALQIWPARSRDSWTIQALRTCYGDTYETNLANAIFDETTKLDTAHTERLTAQIATRTGIDGRGALEAVAIVQRMAAEDGVTAVAGMRHLAQCCGIGRALELISDHNGDPIRLQLMRHWFLRCFHDAIDHALLGDQREPEQAVSRAEAHEVARMIATGKTHQLIGPDQLPLITAHGTQRDDLDRRLQNGENGAIAPYASEDPPLSPEAYISRAAAAWARASRQDRQTWLNSRGLPVTAQSLTWPALQPPVQSRWITDRVLAHHATRIVRPFRRVPIGTADPAAAAGQVFNQPPLPTRAKPHDARITNQIFHTRRALSPAQLGLAVLGPEARRIHELLRHSAAETYNLRRYSNAKRVTSELAALTSGTATPSSSRSQPIHRATKITNLRTESL
ncbi:hypothetical protein [Microlunatus sp. GCM10028923]|uniref:hypothetical protein n=1 Tax=Microlunatus sp. GCM10028923 TaxID=3273400 RepID=UPI0036116C40